MTKDKCKTCGGKGYILNDNLGLTHSEYEDCPYCGEKEMNNKLIRYDMSSRAEFAYVEDEGMWCEYEDVLAIVDKLESENEKLKVIVDRYPKTVDGVPIVAGGNYYALDGSQNKIVVEVGILMVEYRDDYEGFFCHLRSGNGDEWICNSDDDLFSTQEAEKSKDTISE